MIQTWRISVEIFVANFIYFFFVVDQIDIRFYLCWKNLRVYTLNDVSYYLWVTDCKITDFKMFVQKII